MAESVQKRLQTELDQFQNVHKDINKHSELRQQLEGQLSENTLVIEELNKLDEDAGVFKMVGPVLIKQDLNDAKQNVQKRMDYINVELKRYEAMIKEMEKDAETRWETLSKLQHQLQQVQAKGVAKL